MPLGLVIALAMPGSMLLIVICMFIRSEYPDLLKWYTWQPKLGTAYKLVEQHNAMDATVYIVKVQVLYLFWITAKTRDHYSTCDAFFSQKKEAESCFQTEAGHIQKKKEAKLRKKVLSETVIKHIK
jgi:hypothetical protein